MAAWALSLSKLAEGSPGSRFTVRACGAAEEATLRRCGFRFVRRVVKGEPSMASNDRWARSANASSFWAIGDERLELEPSVDYVGLESSMDPADRSGAVLEPKSAKAARSYVPIAWEKERWDIGLPEELDRMALVYTRWSSLGPRRFRFTSGPAARAC